MIRVAQGYRRSLVLGEMIGVFARLFLSFVDPECFKPHICRADFQFKSVKQPISQIDHTVVPEPESFINIPQLGASSNAIQPEKLAAVQPR
jgi:hypothetical protein